MSDENKNQNGTNEEHQEGSPESDDREQTQESPHESENLESQKETTPEQLMEELRSEVEKYKNEYLYLRAEMETVRRQAQKERLRLLRFGHEGLALDLLNVIDIFETALNNHNDINLTQFEEFKRGIELTASELKSTLKKYGVEEVPSLGEPFDPSLHEALAQEPSEEKPPGTVTKVFKKPYKIYDRILRAGSVVVAKEKSEETSNE